MNSEYQSLLVAAIVWGLFIVAGSLGRPFKMSATISVGGGFIVACIVAILAKIYFDNGFAGLITLFVVIWLLWGLYEKLSRR